MTERSSGILLHPSSLPGIYGIGDLGPQAFAWVDFLDQARCGLWQVLPLGPTGYGDSPYQCFSAFAGNPYLISPEALVQDGLLEQADLLTASDLAGAEDFPLDRVDFGRVIPWKLAVLDRAYTRFTQGRLPELEAAFARFRTEQAGWLDDYSLFMAIKEAHGGASWTTWAVSLRGRQPAALAAARQEYALTVDRQAFRQFLFFRQWLALRSYANAKGIRIIGDAPIFVAHDSADVWAHPELFWLDLRGKPKVVAGVPPDYFSPTGQLWGNPLYRWEVHQAQGYRWWIERIRAILGLVDLVRLDHFRGFCAYWEVPGKAKTAEKGRWVKSPGMDFFRALQADLGELPIIAEDLGVITPDVVELRETFGLPGMKIFQFAFGGGPQDPFLPHHYPVNCVAYTGTHDNDTVLGWYQRVPEYEKAFYRRYMNRDGSQVASDMIRGVWSSTAGMALAPLQDFLNLDNAARMNYPGNPSGNWTWRMTAAALNESLMDHLHELNYLYEREKPAGSGAAPEPAAA